MQQPGPIVGQEQATVAIAARKLAALGTDGNGCARHQRLDRRSSGVIL